MNMQQPIYAMYKYRNIKFKLNILCIRVYGSKYGTDQLITIVTLKPELQSFAENVQTLNFASTARRIIWKPAVAEELVESNIDLYMKATRVANMYYEMYKNV